MCTPQPLDYWWYSVSSSVVQLVLVFDCIHGGWLELANQQSNLDNGAVWRWAGPSLCFLSVIIQNNIRTTNGTQTARSNDVWSIDEKIIRFHVHIHSWIITPIQKSPNSWKVTRSLIFCTINLNINPLTNRFFWSFLWSEFLLNISVPFITVHWTC